MYVTTHLTDTPHWQHLTDTPHWHTSLTHFTDTPHRHTSLTHFTDTISSILTSSYRHWEYRGAKKCTEHTHCYSQLISLSCVHHVVPCLRTRPSQSANNSSPPVVTKTCSVWQHNIIPSDVPRGGRGNDGTDNQRQSAARLCHQEIPTFDCDHCETTNNSWHVPQFIIFSSRPICYIGLFILHCLHTCFVCCMSSLTSPQLIFLYSSPSRTLSKYVAD